VRKVVDEMGPDATGTVDSTSMYTTISPAIVDTHVFGFAESIGDCFELIGYNVTGDRGGGAGRSAGPTTYRHTTNTTG
jgi:hypothetical protein